MKIITLSYLYNDLRANGTLDKCYEFFQSQDGRSMILVYDKARFTASYIFVSRTSRKCYRVVDNYKYHTFNGYKKAVEFIERVIKGVNKDT